MSLFNNKKININNILDNSIYQKRKKNKVKFEFLKLENVIDNYLLNKNFKMEKFEKRNMKGKNVNLLMDSKEDKLENLYNENYLNITCNGGIFYFLERKILSIDYVITPYTNHIFYKNFISFFINKPNIFKDIKGFIKIANRGINLNSLIENQIGLEKNLINLKNNNVSYSIMRLPLRRNGTNEDIIKILKSNFVNKSKENQTDVILHNKYFNSFETKYQTYDLFKKNNFFLTTAIRTILYLLKLGCNIKIFGFSFGIIKGYYHSSSYYKYIPEYKKRLEKNYTKKLSHLKGKGIGHKIGPVYDKYALVYLLEKFPNRIFISDKLKNEIYY